MSSNVRNTTEKLVLPILEAENFKLVDIEYVKEGQDWFLRVFIDKEGGITIDECGMVSGLLSDKLDEVDIIPGNYFLEVSSPGVERPLKKVEDFIENINKNIYVSLYAQIDGEKEYEGILVSFSDHIATIKYKFKTQYKEVQIPYDKIAKARLAVVL
ncbi:MAG TPA: ribosome maturation factor RimP [Candidatus Dormibacteraeota bacterium]|nr:ribosome maturation factor RimP [Candidatus Dormibacteraeota bacterium]